ncbi:hypothetical protein A1O3_04809 [Capronia epimyces CBS 606.96]|uniref:DUF4211 domain-containing protein n=1 Tax=Capronia epimyces CBS 606.96 TaxID=1182542 RepID=W9XU95_9EURO|nr:uncharacterized protein A1O3_04809 [Capronia epimyces CBS 606.96]EXJ84142.1 hypothetical protein A1O3_04809 [Capronia epimyces CBS 606.96]
MAGRAKAGTPRRSVRSQKKQTSLQFSPLPASSPAKANHSPAVQGRLANVRYEGSKHISHRPGGGMDEKTAETTSLPTPEPSSQVGDSGYVLSQSPPQPSLAFSPLPNLSSETYQGVAEEDEDDDLIPSAKKRRRILTSAPVTQTPASTRPRRSTRLQSNSASRPKFSSRSSEESFAEPESSPSRRRSGRLRQAAPGRFAQSPESQYQSSDDALSEEKSTLVPKPASRLSDLGSPESSSDEDIVMASKPTARRRQSKAMQHDPFVVNDDEIEYFSDEEVQEVRAPRARKVNRDDFIVEDDEVENDTFDEASEDNAQERVKSRRLPASHKSPHKRRKSQRQQAELDEDLRDLQDSDQEPSEAKTRTRGGPVTTQRDMARQHLDILRRRRAGEMIPRVEDSEPGEEGSETEGVDIDFIGHPNYDILPAGSLHSSSDTDHEIQKEQDQQDEDEFVVEDPSGRLGRPHPDIPLQFTSFASSKPRELFPHIIEWLVKNKIAPAFSRDDELYNLAFARIDDQVKAQAGSRLISAAWGPEFKRAILARPSMKVVALPGEDEDNIRNCDACNRSGHPARYEFMFSGQPYFKKTLEPVDNSDDEEESYGDDDVSRDENGHVLTSESRRFYLGRFCAANAEMGHKLTHWKYHLNEAVMAYLEEQGLLSAEAIIAREKLNKKKREKEAENIVDSMGATGVIGEFWADFDNDLNDARLGMEDYEKKGGRSRGRVGAIRSKGNGLVREWAGDKYRITKAAESDSEG